MVWSDRWQRLRKKILKRDGYSCVECSTSRKDVGIECLHVHHILPRSDGGEDDVSNLITLCEECHRNRHNGRSTYYDSEFLHIVHHHGPIRTAEVADRVGCHRSTARRRLDQLSESGDIEKIGSKWHRNRSIFLRILSRLSPF